MPGLLGRAEAGLLRGVLGTAGPASKAMRGVFAKFLDSASILALRSMISATAEFLTSRVWRA